MPTWYRIRGNRSIIVLYIEWRLSHLDQWKPLALYTVSSASIPVCLHFLFVSDAQWAARVVSWPLSYIRYLCHIVGLFAAIYLNNYLIKKDTVYEKRKWLNHHITRYATPFIDFLLATVVFTNSLLAIVVFTDNLLATVVFSIYEQSSRHSRIYGASSRHSCIHEQSSCHIRIHGQSSRHDNPKHPMFSFLHQGNSPTDWNSIIYESSLLREVGNCFLFEVVQRWTKESLKFLN